MKAGKLDTYSDLELALMIKLDVFGTGEKRRQALGSRYAAAQKIVNQIGATGIIPNGSQPRADPEKLKKSISAVFNETLSDLQEEIIKHYDK